MITLNNGKHLGSGSDRQIVAEKLSKQCNDIVRDFINEKSPRQVNIPVKLRESIINEIEQKKYYHPDVFKSAEKQVFQILLLSSFPNFLRYLETQEQKLRTKESGNENGTVSAKDQTNVSLQDVLQGVTVSPYSLADFEWYLISVQHSGENLAFYQRYSGYKKFLKDCADKIFPSVGANSVKGYEMLFSWMNNPANQGDIEYLSMESKIKQECEEIMCEFISAGGKNELTLSTAIKQKISEEISTNKNYHPDIFKPAVQTIHDILKLSSFPQFLKHVEQNKQLESAKAVEPASTKTSTSRRNSSKFIPTSPINFHFINPFRDTKESTPPLPDLNSTSTSTSTPSLNSSSFSPSTSTGPTARRVSITTTTSTNTSPTQTPSPSASTGPHIRRVSIVSILNNETPAPLSLQDFTEYLKNTEHSEENIDFYQSYTQYNQLVSNLFNGAIPDADTLNQTVKYSDPSSPYHQLKLSSDRIIHTFFLPNAYKELNLSFKLKSSIISTVLTEKNYHPEVYKEAVTKIVELMKSSSLPHFLKFVENKVVVGGGGGGGGGGEKE
ncbi:hypothetical protein BKA69DRAFT_1091112 [Paraphysoderma sedebokerense]|nr:hypothetical protein BKA69DRAFT_1091112 [Paraphysoderma sedebokerense]